MRVLFAVIEHQFNLKTGDAKRIEVDRFVSLGAASNAAASLNAKPVAREIIRAVTIGEVVAFPSAS